VRFGDLHSLFFLTDNLQGFPFGDPEVRDFLIGDENVKKPSEVVQFRYLKFFESLFTKVGDKIKCFDVFDSYEALAKHWHDKLSDAAYRSELYSDAVKVRGFFSCPIAI
jgi:hypothetical protein